MIEVGPLEAMTLEDFQRAMDSHYWGTLHTVLAVLPAMRQRGWGRIVNISSLGGKQAVPHMLPYTASKFALVGLSHGLRTELDVCFISSLPVMQRHVYTAWADRKPVQIVWVGD